MADSDSAEVADVGVEVVLGRRPDPVVAVAVVQGGQVPVQDLVLAGLAVELAGQHRLAHLADQVAVAARERQLHVLLGDGGTALDGPLVADVGDGGPHRAPDVDATVLVEVAVLIGDDRLLEDRGDGVLRHRHVLVVLLQGGDDPAVAVVDGRGLEHRVGLGDRDGGRQRQEDQPRQHGGHHHDRHPHHGDDAEEHGGEQIPQDPPEQGHDARSFARPGHASVPTSTRPSASRTGNVASPGRRPRMVRWSPLARS